MTLFTDGPLLSTSSMRAEYFPTSDRAVNLPDFIPSCKSAMVTSSSSKALTSGTGAVGASAAAARAAPSAGYIVAAAPVTSPDFKNDRREDCGFRDMGSYPGR